MSTNAETLVHPVENDFSLKISSIGPSASIKKGGKTRKNGPGNYLLALSKNNHNWDYERR